VTETPPRHAFTVYGKPVAKARPRVVRLPNGQSRTYTPKATASWEEMIRYQALGHRPAALIDGPISVDATFYLPKPKSRRKSDVWADRKPDWDNLGKAVTDALEGLFWANDSRIVDCRVRKLYGDPPRVEIEIREVGP